MKLENGNKIRNVAGTFFPAGPWLVFARYPGDEVRALGGSIIRARNAGIAVAIVYIKAASGSFFGDFFPEIRRVFLGGAQGADNNMSSLASLVREIAPATVFFPSRFEEDPELCALSFSVENVLADAGYGGAVWSYELTRVGEVNCVIDISSVVGIKHKALAQLQKQYGALQPSLLPYDLVEQLRAVHIQGAVAAEAFWQMDRFEILRGVTSTLNHLALRYRNEQLPRLPCVSIVIRTKDRPQLLEDALGSLVVQDYPNLDVIVVNDGGISVAREVERFRSLLGATLVELDQCHGRSAAANIGINRARGDWLLMLDDDDLYLAEGIRALVSAALDQDAVYYGKVEAYRYENGKRHYLNTFGGTYDTDLMMFENQIPFIGCLMPIKHVRAIGGVDESLECFEDWDLYLRLAQRCSFQYVDHLVAEYRSFGESFITGKGGVLQQEVGLSKIFGRHLQCSEAARLARAQIAVKMRLIPRVVRHEVNVAENAIRDQLSHQMAEEMSRLTEQTVLVSKDIFVSIIIVNYNGRHHLEKCLPSVFETRKIPFEVIVVDNGSKDNSIVWMHEHWPQVRVIDAQSNLGFGRANWAGIHAANGSYIALLNSDTVVTPDWLAQLARPLLSDPGIGITCSQLCLLARPELLNARGGGMSRLGFGYDIDFGLPYRSPVSTEDFEPVDVLFPSGAAMLMRRQEFLDVRAFDPSFFMYHEDVDLGWRYWLLGKRVVLCPGSLVYHAFGGTTKVEKGAAWRDWMGNRHNLRSLWKNYEFRNALSATRRLVGLWFKSGQWALALHVLIWNLIHIRGTVRERRWNQRMRRFSDADLFARGLVSDVVPPVPKTPLVGLNPDISAWINTPCLWPGLNSAIGRLGPGWYSPENWQGDLIRPTSGHARAFLRVSPNVSGKLVVEMHLPDKLHDESEVVIACNGEIKHFGLKKETFWEAVEMTVRSGNDGLLSIDIDNTSVRPHDRFGNGDLRRIGCVVRSIVFRGDIDEPVYAPSRVSVIITTFKRWDILQLTLAALAQQTWKDFEVIVVDDGSNDGTWEHLQAWREQHQELPELKIFTQENTGQGIARNNALTHAKGELALFIGDDIIPDPNFIQQHVQRHRDVGMPCAVVGYTEWDRSAMRVSPLLEYVNEAGQQFGYRYMKDGDDVPYTCFYTSNVSVPLDIIGIQPFDPAFRTYGWEDIDVGYKLSKRGLRIIFNRLAHARHLHPMDMKDFFQRQVKVGRAISALYDLHPDLIHDQPLMPPPARSHIGLTFARRFVPFFLPLINWLDSHSVRLPERLYSAVLSTGFWIGREQ